MSLRAHVLQDLRYNPFTQTFTAYGYGYSGNAKEVHTIPSTSPYYIYLNEIPRDDTPSTVAINEQGGSNFTEVSFTTSPAATQFRVVYGGDGTTVLSTAGQGIVEFNSADAGKIVEVSYYGLGTINQESLLTSVIKNPMQMTSYDSGSTIKLAYGTYEEVDGKIIAVDEDDYTITDSGLSNGTVYVHLLPDGNGTASAYLATAAGTYDENKGGFYHTDGAKVIFKMTKHGASATYSDRQRIITEAPYYFKNSTRADYYLGLFSQIGVDQAGLGAFNYFSITALSATRIAFIDSNVQTLRALDFTNGGWSQVGNALVVATVGVCSITALSSSRIAFIDTTNEDLRTYDFDGTDWSQTGNDLNIAGIGNPVITALSSSRIAFIDTTNKDLRTYDFDGTDWSQTGNDLNIVSIGNPGLATLSSSRVAFIDLSNQDLRTYDFDGTDWSQTGNDLLITIAGHVAIASLSYNEVVILDISTDSLRAYEFDGTDWSKKSQELYIFAAGTGLNLWVGITSLSSNRVVMGDYQNQKLRTYDYFKTPIFTSDQTPPAPPF